VSDLARFTPVAPYSLSRTVGPFARFSEELVNHVVQNGYRRAFQTSRGLILLEVIQTPSPDLDQTVEIRVLDQANQDEANASILTVRRMVAADEPIQPLYSAMQHHSSLAFLAESLRGLRRTITASPFEGLVFSILAQLISIRGAAVIRGRFVRAFGTPYEFEGQEYWVFPEPGAIRGTTVDDLCRLGMTSAKARAIQTAANLADSGELDRDQLLRLPDDAVMEYLVSLPGIGPWTAEWFMITVLGRKSVVPAGDLGIRRVTGKWLLNGSMPSPKEVRRAYAPFGEYAGYVAYYVLSAERFGLELPSSH
jgi:DNA-3-methyladenine glycosylase II